MLPTRREFPGLYAEFGARLQAFILDCLIFAIATVLLYGLLTIVSRDAIDPARWVLFPVWLLVPAWAYWALFESSALQATPGKRYLKIRVADDMGARMGLKRATLRSAAGLVTVLTGFLGFLMAAFTTRSQALHDRLSHTYVVRTEGLERWRADPAARDETDRGKHGWFKPSYLGWGMALAVLAVIVWIYEVAMANFTSLEVTSAVAHQLGRRAQALEDERDGLHGQWPQTIPALDDDGWKYEHLSSYALVHCDGQTCGVVATIGADAPVNLVAGHTAEIWTRDSGKTWQCGPGGNNPVARENMAGNCRDADPL